ncbi:MAG: carbohydrate ABC transporter permease [Actinomycetia bacterium]|nr:carbohydrate ABC transporter permease [Actinomycetes bacterium]
MKNKLTIVIIKYFILALILIFVLAPIIWIVMIAIRYPNEVYQLLPTRLKFDNFYIAIRDTHLRTGVNFLRMYFNSILVSVTSVLGVLIMSSLAAFGLSNYKLRFKEPIFLLLLVSLMIPIQVMLIPLSILLKELNLINTYWVLILPYMAFNCPIAVFILRGFFEEIPKGIKESARIDGASDFTVFARIVLPLSKPALASVLIISFIGVWNEFIFALVFLKDDHYLTIPVALYRILNSGVEGSPYEIYSAMVTLTVFPVIIVFVFFQRWFIEGLTAGALKG